MPKRAIQLDTLPESANLALSGDVQVTCTLTGADGESPEDCTTHDHEHHGTVLIRMDQDFSRAVDVEGGNAGDTVGLGDSRYGQQHERQDSFHR